MTTPPPTPTLRSPRPMIINPVIGDPPAIQWISVAALMVDTSYQRTADTTNSLALINSIAKSWDWRLCLPLMVSARDGGNYVIDGQHRLLAAVLRGDIPHLPCSVSRYADVVAEANIFVAANRSRKQLSKLDEFRGAVAAGHEAAVRANQMIVDAGLTVSCHTNTHSLRPGQIYNVTGVVTALGRYRHSVVSAALNVIGEAFGDQPIPRPANLFNALLVIFANADDQFDPDLLGDTMQSMTAAQWAEMPALEDVRATGRVAAMVTAIRAEMIETQKQRIN